MSIAKNAKDYKSRLKQILCRFRMFDGTEVGPGIPPGWISVIKGMAVAIEPLLTGRELLVFRITELNHVGGRLNVRYAGVSQSTMLRLEAGPIGQARQRAAHTCVACGASGGRHEHPSGSAMVLCDLHADDLAHRRPINWFDY